MAPQRTREPLALIAGDTISFTRTLSDFPASDGWSLLYELRGVALPYEFTSTASGADHLVTVQEDVTATWLPGDYQLTGFVVQSSTGDRHEFYRANFTIFKNPADDQGNEPVTTHAQRMVAAIEARLEELAAHVLDDSKVETSEFKRVKRKELLDLRNYYKLEMANEEEKQRAANGLPSKRFIRPFFKITSLILLLLICGCASAPMSHGIPNLALVEPGVWRGGQPNAEGWAWLKSQGVLIDVKLNTWREGSDIGALKNGMVVLDAPIDFEQQTIGEPDGYSVTRAVESIRNARAGVYVHCEHGQDRTGLIIGVYRVEMEGWPKADAYKEMMAHGFHPILRGLVRYWEWVAPTGQL